MGKFKKEIITKADLIFDEERRPVVELLCRFLLVTGSRNNGQAKVKAFGRTGQKDNCALDTMFDCPFCNHEKGCEVKMEKTKNTGRIQCTVCNEDFQAAINFLSEPLDVYNEWIDACEAANRID